MTTINSVLGPIDTSTLGFTLMHEHLMSSAAGIPQNYPGLLGDDYMERIIAGLTQAREGGVDTIIDATTFDLGRDATIMAEASQRSGVNIIACTGWFLESQRFITGGSIDMFAQLFIRDIQEGIAGTGIKAGILKSAADYGGVTAAGEVMLRAVARAHLQTDVPILLHSYAPEQVGKRQLTILKEEGVDMKRVKVDHSLETTDIEYLTWLLEQGCYLGMDRFPGFGVSAQARIRTMKALIDAGWAHRLLPSHDHLLVVIMAEVPPEVVEHIEKGNPHGYLYIKKAVLPELQEMGVPESTLTSLCTDNPRNFFEGV